MGVFAKKAGVWKPGVLSVRKVGLWQAESQLSAHVGGDWADSLTPLTVSVSTPSLYADSLSIPETDPVTATPNGGQSPYTYAWTFDSSDEVISITAPTSATTTFQGSGVDPGETGNAVARCTVTDALGAAAFALVAMTLTHEYPT
jgi:hypothetical protein